MGYKKKELTRNIAWWLCLSLMLTFLAGFNVALAEDPPQDVRVAGISLYTGYVAMSLGDQPYTITYIITPNNATNKEVIWSSSDNSKVSVENGVLTAHAAGSAGITATTVDGGYSAGCVVFVSDPSIKVTSVTLNTKSLNMIAGGNPVQLTAAVSPDNATNKEIAWSSDNPAAATVVGGLVTPKGAGTANITASASNGKSDTCVVNVDASGVPVTGISLNKYSLVLDVGKTDTLTAAVIPENATNKNITWSSNNSTVASVSSGVVSGKATGTAIITASANDGGYSKTCEVTVAGILLNKNSLNVAVNSSEKLMATILGTSGKGVQWSSDNASVASVSSDGTVTGLKSGSTAIRAKIEGTETYASCSVSVFIKAVSVSLNKSSLELHKYGKSASITASVSPAEGAQSVTWRSDNTSIASVDGSGIVTPNGIGSTKIYATATNSDGSKVDSPPCDVTVLAPVAPTSISIMPTSTVVQLKRTTTLRAVVTPEEADQRVSWWSDDSSIVSVSNGVLTGVALGKTRINVKANTGTCVSSREITVEPVKVTGVRLSSERIGLSTGSRPTRLTCTVEPGDATNKNVYWSVSDTSHTITFSPATGAVTVNHAGEATIYVKTEDGGYEAHCWVIVGDYSRGYWSPDYGPLHFDGLPELKQPANTGSSGSGSISPPNNSTKTNPITIPPEPVVQKPSVSGFSDMSGNWADSTVKSLVSKGIMKGYNDGTFQPNKSMTRFEFIVALCRSVNLKEDVKTKLPYSDVKLIPPWAKGYVAAAYKAGIIPSVWGKQIQGKNAVTRVEASYMVAKALKAKINLHLKAIFKDRIPTWAEPYVAFVVQKGLVNGYPDKTFKPAKALTRAEASNILNNLIKTKK
ncbi:MAG: Ig-like domain-containing protein [Candidatus Saccharibacteria bacterium]